MYCEQFKACEPECGIIIPGKMAAPAARVQN
jgi:hypothetical protein